MVDATTWFCPIYILLVIKEARIFHVDMELQIAVYWVNGSIFHIRVSLFWGTYCCNILNNAQRNVRYAKEVANWVVILFVYFYKVSVYTNKNKYNFFLNS